uniref:GG17041 n=1 Tax=Drosophila erecta TaxID=7220 RepID=B3P435_DROER
MKCHCDRATALQRNQFGVVSCAAPQLAKDSKDPQDPNRRTRRTTHLHALLQLELQRWCRTYSAL